MSMKNDNDSDNDTDNDNVIIDLCEVLIDLARHEQWEDFEKKLKKRDLAIESTYKNAKFNNMTVSEKNDLETIKRLNNDIKSIVLDKQKNIQKNLVADTQGSKARHAYRQQ